MPEIITGEIVRLKNTGEIFIVKEACSLNVSLRGLKGHRKITVEHFRNEYEIIA